MHDEPTPEQALPRLFTPRGSPTFAPSGSGRPGPASRHHDVTCQTRTPATPGDRRHSAHQRPPRGSSEPTRVSGMLWKTHRRRQRQSLGKRKGLAARLRPLTPSRCWLRGLDLNQRPLGYESPRGLAGNPLISGIVCGTTSDCWFLSVSPSSRAFEDVSGCYGRKTGAGDLWVLPKPCAGVVSAGLRCRRSRSVADGNGIRTRVCGERQRRRGSGKLLRLGLGGAERQVPRAELARHAAGDTVARDHAGSRHLSRVGRPRTPLRVGDQGVRDRLRDGGAPRHQAHSRGGVTIPAHPAVPAVGPGAPDGPGRTAAPRRGSSPRPGAPRQSRPLPGLR